MHWFWRATIGAAAGSVIGVVWVSASFHLYSANTVWERIFERLDDLVSIFLGPYSARVLLLVPSIIVSLAVYGLLTYWLGPVYVENRRRNKGLCVKRGYDLVLQR